MRGGFAAVRAWAETVTVKTPEGERSVRAFIQPLSAVSPPEQGAATPAGVRDKRLYRLIAEQAAFCGPGAEIVSGSVRYELLRCEKIGGSHVEGLLARKAGGEDA